MAKVMTVEDSGLIRSIMRKILVSEGHEIVEVPSGKDGIIKYESEKPDLVFMDINLPDISGLDATKEIIDFDPEAKIVMCTIVDKDEYREKAKELGALSYLVKPFSKNEIVDVLRKYLKN
ncbi:MAG: response regulator [Nanobdellota archaeon]